MTNKYYKCYNADTLIEINPAEKIIEHIKKIDTLIRHLLKIQKDIVPSYIDAFRMRLAGEVNNYSIDYKLMKLDEIQDDLEYLKVDDQLTSLVIRFMSKKLAIEENSKIVSEISKFTSLNWAKSFECLSYCRVKAFTDILGKDEGLNLYTKVIKSYITERNKKSKIDETQTVKSRNERAAKRWCKEGITDFTFTFIDDDQVIYRFDRCVTHEALKDYNDPDIAYAASCYIADIEEWNQGDVIHLRRTQTLHHGDFCDELYYDTRVHKKPPKQPTLEFTKSIGKKK